MQAAVPLNAPGPSFYVVHQVYPHFHCLGAQNPGSPPGSPMLVPLPPGSPQFVTAIDPTGSPQLVVPVGTVPAGWQSGSPFHPEWQLPPGSIGSPISSPIGSPIGSPVGSPVASPRGSTFGIQFGTQHSFGACMPETPVFNSTGCTHVCGTYNSNATGSPDPDDAPRNENRSGQQLRASNCDTTKSRVASKSKTLGEVLTMHMTNIPLTYGYPE